MLLILKVSFVHIFDAEIHDFIQCVANCCADNNTFPFFLTSSLKPFLLSQEIGNPPSCFEPSCHLVELTILPLQVKHLSLFPFPF
jgi:hypothetical protein